MILSDSIYDQIVSEKLIDNIRADKETESVMEALCNHTVDGWDRIIEELEEKFPYAAARLEIVDILQMFLDNIVKPDGLDEGTSVEQYVKDAAEVAVEHFWNYLNDINDMFCYCFEGCFKNFGQEK